MIIVVCTDDPSLEEIAARSRLSAPEVFGGWHRIFDRQVPLLAEGEDLFILAHGAYEGDEGRPVIGDARAGFYLNGEDLLLNLQRIVPRGYRGNLYVDACESANHGDTVSFIEVLKSTTIDLYPRTRVCGRAGASRGLIARPSESGWVEAGRPSSLDLSNPTCNKNFKANPKIPGASAMTFSLQANPHALLDTILAAPPKSAFSDSDGLISFLNLSSTFVQNNPEFKVGQQVCDQVANFVATLRINVFGALKSGAIKPLPGDTVPTTQWDLSVTNVIMHLMQQVGGFTDFSVTSKTYSVTQRIAEFSLEFIKLLFDAVVVPEAVIGDVTSFIQGVGSALRVGWDDRTRTFNNTLLGQCHEAVAMDSSGNDYRYFPKVKFYHITIDSSQTEFTSPCVSTRSITFNFTYNYYVTALAADVLDANSDLHQRFTAFLARAQGANYKDANNVLDKVLGAASQPLSSGLTADPDVNLFGVNLTEYPRCFTRPHPVIEPFHNRKVA